MKKIAAVVIAMWLAVAAAETIPVVKVFNYVQERLTQVMKVFILALVFGSLAHGQTISPVVSEYGKKANGSFVMKNNGLQAQTVTVTVRSFSVGASTPTLRPLDASVHVDLSEMSARVQPGQDHEFTYRITCDAYPCPVMFLVGITNGHTADGLAVRLVLSHAVYLCQRAKNCRADLLRAAGVEVKR